MKKSLIDTCHYVVCALFCLCLRFRTKTAPPRRPLGSCAAAIARKERGEPCSSDAREAAMASYNENDVLKLREIFPTLDEDTIGAVLAHHHGDVYPAMLQLVEMLGDDEVQQATLAVLEAEDLGETAAQVIDCTHFTCAIQDSVVSRMRRCSPFNRLGMAIIDVFQLRACGIGRPGAPEGC
eukprot:3725061-Pleurochrysis_carterae.AAC.4